MDYQNIVVSNTPFEQYDVDGVIVNVKREDLCCPPPGPSFSKIRGVYQFLQELQEGTPIGVLDTVHSKAGWGVAYVCQQLNLPCYNFFPYYKHELIMGGAVALRYNQKCAEKLGAALLPLKAGRSAILYHQAKKRLAEITEGSGIMMPNALKLNESVAATADEVYYYTPDRLLAGTWVVSISSGTIGAGVLKGLVDAMYDWRECIDVVYHMGYSRSKEAAMRYILKAADVGDVHIDIDLIDEDYAYKDKVDNSGIPFPCNEYYDAKAWLWLVKSIHELRQSIVFWNIGE